MTSSNRRWWSGRLILWTAVLVLANVVADVVVGSPMMVIPQLADRFDTGQSAWFTASALLAGAVWSPLLAKAADVHGKRRVLIGALLVACGGALVCAAAPTLWVFLLGRFLQGAAFAAVFLTVALVLQICRTPVAMAMVGLVTSSSSIVGIVEPILMTPVIGHFGYRGVFVAAAVLAAVSAVGVRAMIPESPVRTPGRVDVVGALLLGGGLCCVLAYLSIGAERGWLSPAMCSLLTVGLLALPAWLIRSLRVAEPIIDLRSLNRPILLTLAALVLAGGSFRCMLHLVGVIGYVPAEMGLGYGLGSGGLVAPLFATANVGIAVGGTTAGWLAGRIGPAGPLLGGIAVGAAATCAMLVGVSAPPVALGCVGLLGAAAGAIGASGYNLATSSAARERQGTVAGLVSVVLALGSVVVTIAGAEILQATTLSGVFAGGAPVSSATGVRIYVCVAAALLAAAAVPAAVLARTLRCECARQLRVGGGGS
jgi:MFS family permease